MTSLLKTEAAAHFLSMSPGTLRWWRSVGKGPPFTKCGTAVRYRAEDLEDWISSRLVRPERECGNARS